MGLLLVPHSIPILPPPLLVEYYKTLPFLTNAVKLDNYRPVEFTQTFADRFGWDNLVENVSKVYNTMPYEDRKKCVVFCSNYSQAGAIDLLGAKYNLPPAISGHLNYYLWGPGNFNGELAIVIGSKKEDLEKSFAQVELKSTINSKYASSYQTNLPLYVCRNLKIPVEDVWKQVKNY